MSGAIGCGLSPAHPSAAATCQLEVHAPASSLPSSRGNTLVAVMSNISTILDPGIGHSTRVSTPMAAYRWMASAHSCGSPRSEEHTSELQSRENLVCRLLLEK